MNDNNQEIEEIALKLHNDALSYKEIFLHDLNHIATLNDCKWIKELEEFTVKSIESIKEKIQRKKTTVLTDLLRSTIVINKYTDKKKIIKSLKDLGYQILEIDDLFTLNNTPITCYKHIAIKLRHNKFKDITLELLLMQPAMYEAKMKRGHLLYDHLKEFEKHKHNQQGVLTENQLAQQDIIIIVSNKIYQKAYEIDNEN